jgi:hypothetical protein
MDQVDGSGVPDVLSMEKLLGAKSTAKVGLVEEGGTPRTKLSETD